MSDNLKKMTFSEHFDELRKRLLVSLISVVAMFVICFCFKEYLVQMVLDPYESLRAAQAAKEGGFELNRLVFISPTEKFIFYIKVCFLAAIFLATPILLFQMWRFISAGLYVKERSSVMRVVPLSMLLFMVGLSFGYFVMFPIGLEFLVVQFGNPDLLEASISVNLYFSLFALLILVMGFIFQTPLIMVVTTSVGLTTPTFFSSKRKFFILGAFVTSAILTPPDWITQCFLAGPLVVLFEVGILLSRGVMRRKQKKAEATERKADEESA